MQWFLKELLFPIRDGVLATWIVVATLLWLLASAAGLLGIWLAVILSIAFYKFLMLILRMRALGHRLKPPEHTLFNPVDARWALSGVLWFVIVILIATALAEATHPVFGWATAGIFWLLYPAAISVAAINQSAAGIFNIPLQLAMIRSLGSAYAWLLFCLSVVALLATAADSLDLPQSIQTLLTAYFSVLVFSMTGGLLHEYRDAVDLESREVDDLARIRNDRHHAGELRKIANSAYEFESRGSKDKGVSLIRKYLAESGNTLSDFRWFFDELAGWSSLRPMQSLAPHYLSALVNSNDLKAAIEVLDRLAPLESDYLPDAQATERLAAFAETTGRVKLAAVLRELSGATTGSRDAISTPDQ